MEEELDDFYWRKRIIGSDETLKDLFLKERSCTSTMIQDFFTQSREG